MTFPKPTYEAVIKPANEIQDYSDIAARAYAAFRDHLRANTFWFTGSDTKLDSERTQRKIYASTPKGVIIDSEADTRRTPAGATTPDEYWTIKLFSFTTPVEDTRKTLVGILKGAANL